jgi:NAD(P)-dependent dehydrogenase (short-subunit alcohol dehydrogenase family)
MRLAGKSAIVTGGGRGIGRAICETFAREGCRVLVTDIDVGNAERWPRPSTDRRRATRLLDVSREEELLPP